MIVQRDRILENHLSRLHIYQMVSRVALKSQHEKEDTNFHEIHNSLGHITCTSVFEHGQSRGIAICSVSPMPGLKMEGLLKWRGLKLEDHCLYS